ncbi:ABC transporter substrate-binding protein [Catenulispora pinisilvae]|uniref:ABC transporter substrate-binding protein n=1 Tax=Catenulispora pinisilvae TaxID=2705253 RepID=UPI0018917A8B|nr:ABC transporter substrate-binding protein [Catenulispora pinisilvae]
MSRGSRTTPISGDGSGLVTDRRTLLRASLGGAGLLLAAPALAACGGKSSAASSGGGGGGNLTFGSDGSDPTPRKAYGALTAAYTAASGMQVRTNVLDHNTFSQQITAYLQGTPEDVVTWFAGYRMQFFAAKNLLHPIDDVWDTIGAGFSDAAKKLSKGLDGKTYFVPLYNYPWGVFYRKSLFQAKGYQPTADWDSFVALCAQMKKDGLSPLAAGFGGGDSWTNLGTFDYLNLRINGYDFHMQLMGGKVSWSDPRLNAVMDHWRQLAPYLEPGASGRKWQDAAQSVFDKKSGMTVTGLFMGQAITDDSLREDIDFFAFPAIDPTNGQDAVEAPTDGFVLSAKAKHVDAGKKMLEWIGTSAAETVYANVDPSNVGASTKADTSKYNALQQKSAQMIASAKYITQFGDRDSDPGFISAVVEPGFAQWLASPDDGASTLKKIESQRSQYFTS